MEQPQHQLLEVLCGLWFDPDYNGWDSTYYGKFFDLIKDGGFDDKKEQKGFQVKFEIPSDSTTVPKTQADEIDSRMIFRNSSMKTAISMSPNFISFHKLMPYESWMKLYDEQVKPGLEIYKKIGLGNKLIRLQILYLNQYNFLPEEKISDKFSFLPQIGKFGSGKETVNFQISYDLEPNLQQQILLNSLHIMDGSKIVSLQCSCTGSNIAGDEEVFQLYKQVHDKNKEIFQTITNSII